MENLMDVKNKWTLITGASRGVGKEIAKFMAKQGSNLILQSRSTQHTQKLVEDLEREVSVKAFSCDLESEDSISKFLSGVDDLQVEVDIVFNNAGLQVPYCENYFQNKREDYLTSYAVNCLAPIQIAYHFLPKMVEKKIGRIIMTSSGIADQPELMGYACAKAALTKFVQDFACKLNGTNVMMNAMDPGWLRTDLGGPNAPNPVESVLPGAVLGAFLEDQKSGRWFSAQDYAFMELKEALQKAMQKN